MIRFVNADEPVRKVARAAVTPTLVDEIARVTKNIAEMGCVTKIATKNAGVTEIRAAKKRGRPASGKALTPAQKQRASRERRIDKTSERKGGRPKSENALTAAQRQRASRERRKAKG